MNNITGETPFFRLLVPVVLGIVANEFIEFLPSAVFFSSIGFLAMLLSFFIPKNNEFRYRFLGPEFSYSFFLLLLFSINGKPKIVLLDRSFRRVSTRELFMIFRRRNPVPSG